MTTPEEKSPFRSSNFAALAFKRLFAQKWLLTVVTAIILIATAASTVPIHWAVFALVLIAGTALMTGGETSFGAPAALEKTIDIEPSRQVEMFAVMSSLPDPIFLLHGDGRVIYQNLAAKEAVGVIDPETIIYSLLRAPEVRQALDMIAQGNPQAKTEFVQPFPSRRHFEVHVAAIQGIDDYPTPYADKSRTDTQIVMRLRDLTPQQQLDQMRTDFVANASHELRTPLASLIGFIETLQGAAKDDEKAREKFLSIMVTQARRMSRLIDDLLSLNRIEMNVHIRPDENVDFSEIVHHVVDTLKPIADNTGVEIDLNIATGGLWEITGDRDELVQVVQNLVENAIKYGQDGKRVDISLVREVREFKSDFLHLKIRDYGPGIAPEYLPRLTERFYRVDVVSSREKGGTGLGLAIVKHILNRHRGNLNIESAPGQGATFIVTLEDASEYSPQT